MKDIIKNIKYSRISLCEKILYDIFNEIQIYESDNYINFYIINNEVLFAYNKKENEIIISEDVNTFFVNMITNEDEFDKIVTKYIGMKINKINFIADIVYADIYNFL